MDVENLTIDPRGGLSLRLFRLPAPEETPSGPDEPAADAVAAALDDDDDARRWAELSRAASAARGRLNAARASLAERRAELQVALDTPGADPQRRLLRHQVAEAERELAARDAEAAAAEVAEMKPRTAALSVARRALARVEGERVRRAVADRERALAALTEALQAVGPAAAEFLAAESALSAARASARRAAEPLLDSWRRRAAAEAVPA